MDSLQSSLAVRRSKPLTGIRGRSSDGTGVAAEHVAKRIKEMPPQVNRDVVAGLAAVRGRQAQGG
jgi:hypothetical protein